MRKIAAAAALGLALATATASPAYADPSIWVQCDGQPKPEGAATTAARLGAIVFIPIIGLLAAGETGTGTPAAVGQLGVDACTQALADPVLQNFWQRHLNILRARAIHYVEVGNNDAALADLEAMHGVADGQTASPLLDRSIGVSSLLIEAALRARNGEMDKARELAVQAAEARPYSLPIQQVAQSFFSGSPMVSADEQRLLKRIISYDPNGALRLPFRLDQTDDPQAAADAWEVALAGGDHMTAPGLDARMGWTPEDGPDGYTLLRASLAMARAGRLPRAIELSERANAKLGPETASTGAGDLLDSVAASEAPPEAAPPSGGSREALAEARRVQLRARIDQTLTTTAAPYRPLLRAWLASARGDDAAAFAIIQTSFDKLPKIMASADLLRRLRQNTTLGGQVPEFLVQSAITGARPDPAARYAEVDLDDWIRGLPQFERVDGQAAYRPGRTIGYSESDIDGGLTRVAYAGGSYYAGKEMALFRAAQVAKERGFDSFIVQRAQYATLEVSFLNASSPSEEQAPRASRAVAAEEVIANLQPIYVDLPAAMDLERRGGRRRN